jgi:hypothetical protein
MRLRGKFVPGCRASLGALPRDGQDRVAFMRRFAPLQLQNEWEGG